MVFRVHGEDMMFGSSVHPVSPRIPQVKMMKVHIPFTFKLVESSKSSYSGESFALFLCTSRNLKIRLEFLFAGATRLIYRKFLQLKLISMINKNRGEKIETGKKSKLERAISKLSEQLSNVEREFEQIY